MLELRGVGVTVGDHAILRNVDLTLRRGEMVLVKGASGSGKTTLLRVLGLIDAPTTGEVLYHGRPVGALTDEERSMIRREVVGHVFQSHNMIGDLTILENVMLPMRLAGRADPERARRLLASVGVEGRDNRLPAQVSIGERQRAAFARALANDPDVVLADEPTASVDASRAEAIADVLLDLWKQGRTIVVASHDPRVWTRLADARTFEMRDGALVEEARA